MSTGVKRSRWMPREAILQVADRMKFFKLMQRVNPDTLTVLNYHRIDDPVDGEFSTFKPNVSATPAMFEQQMDYLCQNYNAVSGEAVAAWVRGESLLPPRAALITFDDGYFDNLTNAFPVLSARRLPAIIFLATNFIDNSIPFYWDLVAYCFNHTQTNHVDIPPFGPFVWEDEASKNAVVHRVIELAKKLPNDQKEELVHTLPAKLSVNVPVDQFSGMMLKWSDVRFLSENGIEMGAHTAGHPILTRIPIDEAGKELSESKRRIEDEIGKPVISFAYPNGHTSDFNDAIIDSVRRTGFQTAYTLLPGPTRSATVKQNPYRIRRIFLSHKDTLPRFAGKLVGLARVANF